MKKRLLSAALALAMVLTLLPVSAFAATTTGLPQNPGEEGTRVTYVALNQADGRQGGNWYWLDNTTDKANPVYYAVTSGFIVGTSSGAWYSSESAWATKNPTARTAPTGITLLSSLNMGSFGVPMPTSFTADVNGHALTLGDLDAAGANGDQNVTSITINNGTTKPQVNTVGSVSAVTTNRSAATARSGMTLTVNNATIASINLQGRANTVKLEGANVTGTIQMSGNYRASATAAVDTLAAQQLNVDQDTNKVTTLGGPVTITGGTSGSSAYLRNATDGQNVSMTSQGGTITVTGNSVLGDITVSSGERDATKSTAVPTVNMNGGTADSIKRDSGDASLARNTININAGGNGGEVSTHNGIVNVNGGAATDVTVEDGELNVSGANTRISGAITLGASGKSVKFAVNANAANSTVGSTITAVAGTTLTVDLPAVASITYGAITDNAGYTGHNVKGGTFRGPVPAGWLANSGAGALTFQLQRTPLYTYYNQSQLGEALTTQQLSSGSTLTIVGDNGTSQTITFVNGATDGTAVTLGTLTCGGLAPLTLPTEVAGTKVNNWFDGTYSWPSGVSGYVSPRSGNVTLNAQTTNTSVTNITGADVVGTTVRDNVRASLANNVITLTGGVNGGTNVVTVRLTTDLLKSDGTYVTKDVDVYYNAATGATSFVSGQTLGDGITFETVNGLDVLRLSNGVKYTLSGSGIKVINGNLKIAGVDDNTGYGIRADVNISGWTTPQKNELITKLAGTGTSFDWGGSPAVREAINAVAANISQSQIDGWIRSAQQAAWRTQNGYTPSGNTNYLSTTGYDQVWLVPYLAVNVTYYNNGVMNATLVPSYYVEVRQSAPNSYAGCFGSATGNKQNIYSENGYLAQRGQSLGAITGTFGTAELTFNDASLNGELLHQDGTYVYPANNNTSSVWTITHAGKTGLGSIVINTIPATVTMTRANPTPLTTYYYDSLQAAVDETINQTYGGTTNTLDSIIIQQGYTGSTTVSVTGAAREFRVTTLGNHTFAASNATGVVVTPLNTGKGWTVQLTKDTAPTSGNITISSATGGSASVNANPASAGQTVTITLSANAGYTPSGVTVRTANNQTVSVSGSGSTYTFVMPSGSVTVTPSFTQSQTQSRATVTVSNPIRGSGTAATSAGNNQVNAGTVVTVTTTPGTNQRTMGLSVTGTTAVRTGVNTFQFSVPSGVSNVVVTPSFDTNNGTNFSDVWSSEYFSNPVSWAVSKGITNGTGTYTFSPYNSCTREDMVTFLWRANGSPVMSNVRNPFWDVQAGSYYYNAVMWAVSKGITNGVSSTQFGVGQTVTRAQAVTFLYRASNSPASSTNSGFYDVPANEYYARAVTWAKNKGVTDGTSTYAFSPNDPCLRGQIVTFLYRDITGNKA